MKKYFLATNDVELTSIRYNKQRIKSGELVLNEGMPRLLELYEKYGVKASFFVTGDIAKAFPAISRLIVEGGHELASHSYSHEDIYALDKLSLAKQKDQMYRAKCILEDSAGTEVRSFRAPALRVNEFTARALHETGYDIDSSISPQRADMFFSFGALAKLDRLWASRYPGYVKENDLSKRGDFPVFEIPISALALPYIGTTMRICPAALKGLRNILAMEANIFKNPINFLIHPNECMVELDSDTRSRRSKSFLSYLFAEKIRGQLKLRNLGEAAIALYEEHLEYFATRGFKFITCSDYFKIWKQDKENL
jgi:peptidoglycan/xylan/chitin deacetylase (PgdA/CDA1 family)